MKGSIKILEVAGISIKIHITFFLLIIFFGKWFFFVVAVFFFVTLHELAHSLVAKHFGVPVKEITLLPIGGVAQMGRMPDKPYQEFLISIAGPLTNIAVIIIFYFPVKILVGPVIFTESLRYFFSHNIPVYSPMFIMAMIYWINLILAGFNLIPAFPMDGGRILRSLLAQKMGLREATRVAVNFGHAFALLFAFIGISTHHFFLLIIAIFIYMGASSEEVQVDLKTTLGRFKIKDILSEQFITLSSGADFKKVLDLIFHSRQEDFPVMDEANTKMVGFVTRYDVMNGINKFGLSGQVNSVMRSDVPSVTKSSGLDYVQGLMQSNGIKALPVMQDGRVIGIVTTDDINRVYSMMTARR